MLLTETGAVPVGPTVGSLLVALGNGASLNEGRDGDTLPVPIGSSEESDTPVPSDTAVGARSSDEEAFAMTIFIAGRA